MRTIRIYATAYINILGALGCLLTIGIYLSNIAHLSKLYLLAIPLLIANCYVVYDEYRRNHSFHFQVTIIRVWLADKTKPYTNSIKEFVYDVFAPSKLAYVKFRYLEQYKKQNPVIKEHIVLAKVRRTASVKEIAEVFNLDAPPKVTYTIKDVKVLPITKLPRV